MRRPAATSLCCFTICCFAIGAAGLFPAAPAARAQTAPPAWEVAGGWALGIPFAGDLRPDCDLGAGGAQLSDCSFRSQEWWLSPAWHASDHVAIVGEISGRYVDAEPSIAVPGLPPIDADLSWSTYGFSGGVRVSGPRGRVTPFFQALAGFGRSSGTVSVLGMSASDSASGLLVEPAGGIDIRVAERTAIRILAGYGAAIGDGATNHAVRVAAGVVFGLGSR